ncbi:MAG: methyltransferase [Bryobacteraceae bacterium]
MTDPIAVVELIEGFQRSQILFAAVRLGIFDGARPKGSDLERLLEACASLGLLEKRGSEFVNTESADLYLRSASPQSLAGFIKFASSSLYPRWGELDLAVMEGKARANPLSIPGILGRAYRRLTGTVSADVNRDFNAGMHGLGMISSPAVAAAFDLSGFQSVVDLGGSTGHLAMAIGDRYPGMKLTVFELPHVIPVARKFTGERVVLHAGDLFVESLPPSDLYALGKVLHNCNPERCGLLLRKIYEALPKGGALLVVERLLDDDRCGPVHVVASSLNMLVASHGRERTFVEYRDLLAKAGFADVQMRKTGALVDAILARK